MSNEMEMDTERIDLLILARLSGPGKKPPAARDVRDNLARFVEPRLGAAEWRARFDERVAALRDRGDLEPKRLAVTDAGRARVAAALGVDPVPPWQALKAWILPALALGLSPAAPRVRDRLKGEDLPGMVVHHLRGLPGSDTPTRRQVEDRLAWQQLGVDTDRTLTLAEVRRHLLAPLLDGGSRLPADKLVPLLAATALEARRPSADAMREALVRRWLENAGPGSDTRPATAADARAVTRADTPAAADAGAVTAEGAQPAFDLAEFARVVQAAADREQDGRFGTRKVFIAAAWRRLRQAPAALDMDLDTFKRHLVDANRADLLALHRADLVPVMDPAEVRASEITYGNATFHFIESPFVRR
jgi:hypothetical protein